MFDVVEDQAGARVRQIAVFLPNRLGALLAVTNVLERHEVRMCAISILEAADHAVVRMVVDKPELAVHELQEGGYQVCETDLLGVVLPRAEHYSLRGVLRTLLVGELNVAYMYSLITRGEDDDADILVMYVEDAVTAARLLVEKGYRLVNQDEIG